MIALNVGCSVAMNWIQRIVMLSRAPAEPQFYAKAGNTLILMSALLEQDNQRFFATLRMTGRRS